MSDVLSRMDTSKGVGNCYEWTGHTDTSGYGRVWRDGRKHPVHRMMYEFVHGPIPKDMYVCHHCDNKKCMNPTHLFLGTQKDNMQDWTKKGKNRMINEPHLRVRERGESERKKISEARKKEFSSGKRHVIRGPLGRILGTRITK